jgi:GNAT superfamily N-acetyltransferase
MQIVDLRSRAFGRPRALTAAYLEWKYEQNPYLDDPILHLALADGRVVGMRGTYGSQWQFGSAGSWVIPAAGDFAVDRDHRGRWVAQQLAAFAQEDLTARGYDYIFSTSANLTSRLLRIRSGWRQAAAYQTFRRGDFPQSITPRRQGTRRRPILLTRVVRRVRNKLRNWNTHVPVPFERFDEWAAHVDCPFVATAIPRLSQMCELVSRCSDPSRIRHVRDERFYEWRLRDPRCHYRFIFYEQIAGPGGFFILQQYARGPVVTIVDWATSTPEVWTKLLHAAVGSNIERLQIASTTFSQAQEQSLLLSGFELLVELDTRTHPAPGILIDALSNPDKKNWTLGGQRLLDPDRWDMRMIYSDQF